MSDKGYIKIDRQILDSEVFAHRSHLKIWIWLLCKASYKTRYKELKVGKGYTVVKLEKGELLFGRHKAEEALDIDGSMIYRTLQRFEELGMVNIKENNQYSIISIANWVEFQEENEQPMNNERTTDEQPMNNERTTDEHKQESKESNKKEEEKIDKKEIPAVPSGSISFEEFSKLFQDKFVDRKDIIFPEWIEKTTTLKQRLMFYLFDFRPKTNKKLKNTGTSITRIIKRMEDDCGKCPDIALANLEYSITKSYDMIYPEPAGKPIATLDKPFDLIKYAKNNYDALKANSGGPYSWKNTLVAVLEKEYKCSISEYIDQNLPALTAITDIVEFAKEIKSAVKPRET